MRQIWRKCIKCVDGEEAISVPIAGGGGETTLITCRTCGGSSEVESELYLSQEFLDQFNDMKNKVNDIMDKCNDIFEKVNE